MEEEKTFYFSYRKQKAQTTYTNKGGEKRKTKKEERRDRILAYFFRQDTIITCPRCQLQVKQKDMPEHFKTSHPPS
jgi:hypothetical protein